METITLINVIYDGTTITSFWQPTPTGCDTIQMQVVPATGPPIIQTFPVPPGSHPIQGIMNAQLSAAIPATFQVTLLSGGSPVAQSWITDLITCQQLLTSVVYDGTRLTATWPSPQSIMVSGFTLELSYPSSGLHTMVISVTIDTPTAVEGSMLVGPLSTTTPYQFALYANAADGITSSSTPYIPLLLVTPALSTVITTGNTIQATWPPVSSPLVTSYTLGCTAPGMGTISRTFQGGATASGSLVLGGPLDPTREYAVSLLANTALQASTIAPTVAPIVAVPDLNSVVFDGTGFTVTWHPISNVGPQLTAATLFCVSPGNPSYNAPVDPQQNKGTLVPSAPPFNPGAGYAIYLNVTTATGVQANSRQIAVVGWAPVITGARYDGQKIIVAWEPITDPTAPVSSFTVQVRSQDGTFLISSTIPGRSSTQAELDVATALDTNKIYQALVTANSPDIASALSSPLTLVPQLPQLQSAEYNGTGITATWTPPINPAVPIQSYSLLCYPADGGSPIVGLPITSGTTGTLPLPTALEAGRSYLFQVRANTTADAGRSNMGACTQAVAIPTCIPTITEAHYDGQNITVGWELDQMDLIQGYIITILRQDGTVATTMTVADPLARNGSIAQVIGAAGWKARVSAVAGGNGAPNVASTGDAVTLIYGQPKLAELRYDDDTVWARIQLVEEAPVQGYIIEVLEGDVIVGSTTATGNSSNDGSITTTVVAPLGGTNAYSVQARGFGNLVYGPPGAASAFITAPAPTAAITVAAGTVVATVNAALPKPEDIITGYQGFLYQGDQLLLGPIPADLQPEKPTITFSTDLRPGNQYSIRVQALGAGPPMLLGPLGPATAAIAGIPGSIETHYDGTRVRVAWTPVADAEAAGYIVAYDPGTGIVLGYTGTTNYSFTASPGSNGPVQVAASGAGTTGMFSSPAAVITEQIAITSATFDGALINAAWHASAMPGARYQVILLEENNVVQTYASTGTTALLPATLGSQGSYSLQVRSLTSEATGAPGPAIPFISRAPAITGVITGADKVMVQVEAFAGATLYQAALYQGDTKVAVSDRQEASSGMATLTIAYSTSSYYNYTVRAWGAGPNGSNITGPEGDATDLIVAAPALTSCDYDGTHVRATWTPASPPQGSGFMVTVAATDSSDTSTAYTDSSSIVIAKSLEIGKDYTVVVQGIANTSIGPESMPGNPLAGSVGYFFPSSLESTTPYLFRADIRQIAAHDITAYLPELFNAPHPAPITVPPFTLRRSENSADAFPYVLTIPATDTPINVWHFAGNGIREPLSTAYSTFLGNIETAEPAGLKPGAMRLLRQVIARILPLNFAEVLYYGLGFNPQNRQVDLDPGMRLRIDFGPFQFVGPNDAPLGGYAGSGTSIYDLGTIPTGTGSLATVFDSFLSRLTTVTINPTPTGGGSGIIDVSGTAYQYEFARLVYPATILAASDKGAPLGLNSPSIVVADSFSKLEAATQKLLGGGNLNGMAGTSSLFFRGRTMPIAEIPCTINGSLVYVSAGTTVGQLIERFTALPLANAIGSTGIDYRRSIANVIETPIAIGESIPLSSASTIHLDRGLLNDHSYPLAFTCFDLPVLPGDILITTNQD